MKKYIEFIAEAKKKKPKHDSEYAPFQVAQGERETPKKKKIKEDREITKPEVSELHKSLTRSMRFSRHDQGLIHTYTGDSKRLNSHLFRAHQQGVSPNMTMHHGFGDDDEAERHGYAKLEPHEKLTVPNMDNLVSKNFLQRPVTVYAGLHKSPEHSISHHPGEEGKMIHPGYLSTSIDKDQAWPFGKVDKLSKHQAGRPNHKHIMQIHVPVGHPAAYVANHSHHDYEKEMILPRGSHLRVHKKPTIDDKDMSITWHAHLEPHKEF